MSTTSPLRNYKRHFLVPGGAGYIGSVLVPSLLAAGNKVTVLDQFYFGHDTLPEHPKLITLKQDIRNLRPEFLTDVDAIIDLAAMSNDPCGEIFSALTEQINFQARVRTATLARQAGVKRYILPSSCSVYGFQPLGVCELSSPNPLTVYAQSNLNAESHILKMASDTFCVTALRLATVFGYSPRMRLDLVVNSMAYSVWKNKEIIIFGGGTQKRPLIHVEDVASVIIQLLDMEQKEVNGQTFNVGSQTLNYVVNDIAREIAEVYHEATGDHPRIVHAGPRDTRSYHVNFTRLATLLGREPERSLKMAAGDIIQRLHENRIRIGPRCYTLDWYSRVLGA